MSTSMSNCVTVACVWWCGLVISCVVLAIVVCGRCVANDDVLYEVAFGWVVLWCLVHLLPDPAEHAWKRVFIWDHDALWRGSVVSL